jgi:hypothetical protein
MLQPYDQRRLYLTGLEPIRLMDGTIRRDDLKREVLWRLTG